MTDRTVILHRGKVPCISLDVEENMFGTNPVEVLTAMKEIAETMNLDATWVEDLIDWKPENGKPFTLDFPGEKDAGIWGWTVDGQSYTSYGTVIAVKFATALYDWPCHLYKTEEELDGMLNDPF